MPANTRDQAEIGDIIQDGSTINYSFDVEGEQLWSTQAATTQTLGIIQQILWGIKKTLGEVGRRHGATKWNGADIGLTGTISTTGTAITGVSTLFTTELQVGDYIGPVGGPYREVSAIASATSATLNQAFASNLAGVAYVRLQKAAERFDAFANNMPRGGISGLLLSYSNTTTLGISAGRFRDSTDAYTGYLASAFTKTTSAWAAGTGNGGLDTGTIAVSTWYHWYAIYAPTTKTTDIIFSTSASAPTLPTGYTAYRLIGSAKTNGSSQWVNFIAHECNGAVQFNLYSVVQDYALANPGTSAVLVTLPSVPSGLSVEWIGSLQMGAATVAMAVVVTSPEQADVDPAIAGSTVSANTGQFMAAPGRFFTDTSQRLRYRCSASGASNSMSFNTYGWKHYR